MGLVDITFRIGGESGDGIISLGEILTKAFARSGREVYTFRTYPAEIRGGHSMFQVRVAGHLLLSQGEAIDVLVALNREGFDRHKGAVRKSGNNGPVLVYDADEFHLEPGEFTGVEYPVPLTSLTREKTRSARSKNMVALGVLAELFDVDYETAETVAAERFAAKTAIQEINVEAARAGRDWARENLVKRDSLRVGRGDTTAVPRLVMSGNQALALGALVAGCRFYAGYPITPATDIMEWLSAELPKFGGLIVQAEDEIAALGMVLGASFAGQKAMTATSGPGVSLMVEMLGLATMVELPLVLVDVQRGGPSTGLPTKTEQGDLNIAIYGAHGDAPHIVLAPASVTDAFQTAIDAFNLAERYQVPVIILSDQYLGYREATVPPPDVATVKRENRWRFEGRSALPPGVEFTQFPRYAITDSGIGAVAIPGTPGGQYTATGLEHGPTGTPGYDPKLHEQMTAKRARKIAPAAGEPAMTRRWGAQDASIGVLSWGSQEGVIRDAVERANREGIPVAALHTRLLSPLPVEPIQEFVNAVKTVIIPELNASGQYAGWLRRHLRFDGRDVIEQHKVAGMPFNPAEIHDKIQEVYEHHA